MSNNYNLRYEADFLEAMRISGIKRLPRKIIEDGNIHRFDSSHKSKQDGWYIFYGIAGAFGDWAEGIKQKWSIDRSNLSSQDQEKLEQQQQLLTQRIEEEKQRKWDEYLTVADKASVSWQNFATQGNSDYLTKKQINSVGIKFIGSVIVVPLRDVDNKMWSYQTIDEHGNKQFLAGGRKKGCFHILGAVIDKEKIYVCEGYATGVSVYMATNTTTVIAFDAGNLEPVVAALRERYPEIKLVIAADNDCWHTEGKNAGVNAASSCSEKFINVSFICPVFDEKHDHLESTDFNDLHCLENLAQVKSQLENLSNLSKVSKDFDENAQSLDTDLVSSDSENPSTLSKDCLNLSKVEEPSSLRRMTSSPPCLPIDAFGKILGAAILGIHDKIQAPLAICAQSVLANVSLVTQAHIDIELPFGQKRPTSLYLLSIAESGERKSSADNEASIAVKKKEAILRKKYISEHKNWQLREEAIKKVKSTILAKTKSTDPKTVAKEMAAAGESSNPPLFPTLTTTEPTFEGMTNHFVNGQPTLGLFSTEGGQFISGNAMNQENKIKTATAFSLLWDGEPIKRMRAGDGSYVLVGKRFACHLMIQPGIDRKFFSDELLLKQGILSRFLPVFPTSLIGTRLYKPVDHKSEQSISSYNQKMEKILELPMPLATDSNEKSNPNELNPREITFSEKAKQAFFNFSDEVEKNMRENGKFETIRGFASKLPEHACRIAANLAFFENPSLSVIDNTYFERGKTIAIYYAEGFLRLLEDWTVPLDILDAERLLSWFKNTYKKNCVPLCHIYQKTRWVRSADKARKLMQLLEIHNWVTPRQGGAEINGKHYKFVWNIREEFLTPEYMGNRNKEDPADQRLSLDNFRQSLDKVETTANQANNTYQQRGEAIDSQTLDTLDGLDTSCDSHNTETEYEEGEI